MNFIEYKGNNVNLDLVTTIKKVSSNCSDKDNFILFYHDSINERAINQTEWQFDTAEERDVVYEHAIQFTNFTQIVID